MDSHSETLTARLMRVEDAARLLSIGRTTAYGLIASGQLHAVRLGRATRISDREIDRFIRSFEPTSTSPDAA